MAYFLFRMLQDGPRCSLLCLGVKLLPLTLTDGQILIYDKMSLLFTGYRKNKMKTALYMPLSKRWRKLKCPKILRYWRIALTLLNAYTTGQVWGLSLFATCELWTKLIKQAWKCLSRLLGAVQLSKVVLKELFLVCLHSCVMTTYHPLHTHTHTYIEVQQLFRTTEKCGACSNLLQLLIGMKGHTVLFSSKVVGKKHLARKWRNQVQTCMSEISLTWRRRV